MSIQGENEAFARLIFAIEPWLGEVVIIGGWAHQLYRLHPSAQPLDYVPLTTLDADVALPAELSVSGQDIRERLVANGFSEQRFGGDKPPATHYGLREARTGFFAEFLTPLKGSEYERRGERKATKRIAGVVSQQLRYLEILLQAPWRIDLDQSNGFPLPDRRTVQVANPTAFLAHKVLVHQRRSRGKFAKDILYIHDTLEIFGARLGDLHREWHERVRPRLQVRAARTVERGANKLFGEMSESVREASRMAGGRRLAPEAIREACQFGLEQVFG
jgi:Nucleotidyltransferase